MESTNLSIIPENCISLWDRETGILKSIHFAHDNRRNISHDQLHDTNLSGVVIQARDLIKIEPSTLTRYFRNQNFTNRLLEWFSKVVIRILNQLLIAFKESHFIGTVFLVERLQERCGKESSLAFTRRETN